MGQQQTTTEDNIGNSGLHSPCCAHDTASSYTPHAASCSFPPFAHLSSRQHGLYPVLLYDDGHLQLNSCLGQGRGWSCRLPRGFKRSSSPWSEYHAADQDLAEKNFAGQFGAAADRGGAEPREAGRPRSGRSNSDEIGARPAAEETGVAVREAGARGAAEEAGVRTLKMGQSAF